MTLKYLENCGVYIDKTGLEAAKAAIVARDLSEKADKTNSDWDVENAVDYILGVRNAKTDLLERLADKLEGKGVYEKAGPVPTNKFDMDHWGQDPVQKGKDIVTCNTSACAAGWAATDTFF